VQFGPLVSNQKIANTAFPANDVGNDFLHFQDQLLFGFAERDLILVET